MADRGAARSLPLPAHIATDHTGLATSAHDLVVVGASAGGVEALRRFVADLPADLAAAVVIVLHVPPNASSALPTILDRAGVLPAAHARDGDRLVEGRIYVAPPSVHLLVKPRGIRLSVGPSENGHRPSIDALFRSAAESFGPRVVGIILSGSLDDGAAGLLAVSRAGGVTVVQDPDDALYPAMPRAAMARVAVDVVAPVDMIAARLADLVGRVRPTSPARFEAPPADVMAEVMRDASRDSILEHSDVDDDVA